MRPAESWREVLRPAAGAEPWPIGLGCMPMSLSPDRDERAAVRAIRVGVDAGCTLLDTADAYAWHAGEAGHNERLIARALRGHRRDQVVVVTKGGHVRPAGRWAVDGRPEHLHAACRASLRALATDRIDLYLLHRPDPAVPLAESVGALAELRGQGLVRHVGLSNVTTAQLREAERVVPIAAVEGELSLGFLHPLSRGELQACMDRSIPYLAWAPLGGVTVDRVRPRDVASVRSAAAAHGVSPERVALAWLCGLHPNVVPIPGTSRAHTALDSLAAASLRLAPEETAAISRSVGLPAGPASGR